jgi:glutamate N-acetyltransferase/amino-acid N-acetyltransferase
MTHESMRKPFQEVPGSVAAPKGFLASAVFCDIKRLGTGKGSEKGKKRDLALVISQMPATVAGMFTTNQVCAPPVKVCLDRVKKGIAQAIVVNSGNANACTGKQGLKDAYAMTELVAKAVAAISGGRTSNQAERAPMRAGRYKFSAQEVLVASTGRIGVPLPMANVRAGIVSAVKLLDDSAASADHVAEAIMTSDTRPKRLAVEFNLGGKTVRIGGICKGAGMIQPGLSATGKAPAAAARRARPPGAPLQATMLCFITTDAAIERKPLQAALTEAVANSFNRITVDGDMSTNDTVLVLANGMAGNPVIGRAKLLSSNGSRGQGSAGASPYRDFEIFQTALNHVCLELAKMIVRDGEGVSRFVTVRVNGARSYSDAEAAARAVAQSALVKTSWCGGDPNWGRIIAALGYSAAAVVEASVDIGYSMPVGSSLRCGDGSSVGTSRAGSFGTRAACAPRIHWALRRGQPTQTPFKTLCGIAALPEFELHIHLNLGNAHAVIYTTDLTEAYVDFNKGDVNDPASLGG